MVGEFQCYGFELHGMMLLGSIRRRAMSVEGWARGRWPCHPLLRSSMAVPRGAVLIAGVVVTVRWVCRRGGQGLVV